MAIKSWWNNQGAPSGPYTYSIQFSKRKRRNPDIVISAPSGPIALVPRYGAQDRQESIAKLLTASLQLSVELRKAVNHAKGLESFDPERAERLLNEIWKLEEY